MILQVRPDTGQVQHGLDAHFPAEGAGSDAGKLEQLRGADGAGAEHGFPAARAMEQLIVAPVFHPGDAPALACQPGDMGGGDDVQVGAGLRRFQEGLGSAATPAAMGGQLEVAYALLAFPVEIVVGRNARFQCGINEGVGDLPPEADIGYRQRPPGGMMGIRTALLVLRLEKIGQYLLPGPARIAHGGPFVIILGLAADVQQTVQRTGTAQHLAPGPVQPSAVEPRIRIGSVAPVHRRIMHGLEVAHRHMNPGVGVPSSGFQQQHPDIRILGQSRRDGTSSGTRPGHDEIVGVGIVWHAQSRYRNPLKRNYWFRYVDSII